MMKSALLSVAFMTGFGCHAMAAKSCNASDKVFSVNVDNQHIPGNKIDYRAVFAFKDDKGAVRTITDQGKVRQNSDEITDLCVPKRAEHVDLSFGLIGFNGGKYKKCDGASQDIAKDSVMLIHVDPDVKDYTNFKCSVEFLTH
jgi:hypothetical protein